MEESVLLGTKPLVDSICHLCECRILNDVTIPAFCFIFMLLFYLLYLVSI